MIKPFTFTINPQEKAYRAGELVGQPFFIPLSQVALSNNLADILTDLTVIDPAETCAALIVYLLSEALPDAPDGRTFVPNMRLYLGRILIGNQWFILQGAAVEECHRLELPIYKSGDSRGVYGFVVTDHGLGTVTFSSPLTIKIGVRQA